MLSLLVLSSFVRSGLSTRPKPADVRSKDLTSPISVSYQDSTILLIDELAKHLFPNTANKR